VPELPEVETIRRSLLSGVVGRRVVSVDARSVQLRQGIDPRQWRERVLGRCIEGIERRAKYLLFQVPGSVALFHLGMSGRLGICAADMAVELHTHLRLGLDSGNELRFIDPRRFGTAIVLANLELTRYAPLVRLGADPLAPAALEALLASAARSRTAIRNLLLDQSVLAGVGNIYANEALARSGIRPSRPANRVSKVRLSALAEAVREVLEEALRAGGTTLADGGFVDALGQNGYFAVALRVYGRAGQPCTCCGAAIVRRALTNRSAYYCPRCQK
jgi:formamidopyrimidine-DNA glycosylase